MLRHGANVYNYYNLKVITVSAITQFYPMSLVTYKNYHYQC